MNGVGNAIDNQNITNGGTVTKPDDPTDSDHTFVGWFKEQTLTNEWDFTNNTVTEDITLYAKWTRVVKDIVSVLPHKSPSDDMPKNWPNSSKNRFAYKNDYGELRLGIDKDNTFTFSMDEKAIKTYDGNYKCNSNDGDILFEIDNSGTLIKIIINFTGINNAYNGTYQQTNIPG